MKHAFALIAFIALSTPLHAAEPLKDSAAVTPVIATDDALFQQFGGREGLVRLMDDFMVILLDDPRTRDFFVAAKQADIKKHLVDQVCVILGGGCTYTGRGMKESHAQLGIDKASFNALVEDLQKAMDKNNIPFSAQNKLLAALAPQHRDIVTP